MSAEMFESNPKGFIRVTETNCQERTDNNN